MLGGSADLVDGTHQGHAATRRPHEVR